MASRRGSIGQIMLWSGISNCVLVACFVVGANYHALHDLAMPAKAVKPATSSSQVTRTDDQLATARMLRQDNERLTKGVQSSLKVSLSLTRVPQSHFASSDDGTAGANGESQFSDGPNQGELESAAYDAVPTAEETQGLKVEPILRRDPRTGQLHIGNFKSLSFVGDSEECLNMGYAMLGDAKMSNDALDVMASSDSITIAKICAKDGSVIISCRNNQITISPRRSRPDDKCAGSNG